jgi:hypothetical protein
MASKFLNNLSNTYRQSPSLQNQFATEQDYLDLFVNKKTTPEMAQAFNIDDYEFEDEGIKSIINTETPIINQGGNDSPTFTGRKTGFSTQGSPYGNAKGGMHNYDKKTGLGTYMDMAGFVMNPVGFFAKKAFNLAKQKYQNKKREDKAAQDIAEQNALDAAYAAQSQASIDKQNAITGGRYDGAKDRSSYDRDPTGYSGSFRKGGRVGAKDGGSMIQIVKDRLMEKNPAMWGLGYEGLASLQDLITSMPFNQGGIVNIRRR